MRTLRLILISLPWILVLGLVAYLWLDSGLSKNASDQKQQVNSTVILREMEALGKLELVKYNFKEVTELKKLAPEYFYNTIKIGKDSKIAIITAGSATGCIDLTKISVDDLSNEGDTLWIKLPSPELCYYKLNMEQTHIYSLETNPLINKEAFIQEAYTEAETQIKEAALASGILDQTATNAEVMLKPLLEKISGRKVVFVKQMEGYPIDLRKN